MSPALNLSTQSLTLTTPQTSTGPVVADAAWVRYRVAAYLRGRGLSLCVGNDPIFPAKAIDLGKYSINLDIIPHPSIGICDKSLDIIAKGTLDHVFLGHQLPKLKPHLTQLLNDIVSRLREGGHLMVHVMVDPSHWEHEITQVLGGIGLWQAKTLIHRDGQFLGVWKLVSKAKTGIRPIPPVTGRRACIARYGAIGDLIMVTPLIRKLAEDGYAVTMNITPYALDVIKHNPHVNNIILQERDVIPNEELGAYWREWIPEYDKYINLSESIEGGVLKVEGRRDFYTTRTWRQEHFGHINYFDRTMEYGGYPEARGTLGELYFSSSERKAAQWVRKQHSDHFLVLWGLKGSSFHKQYPLLESTLVPWLNTHPQARVMLVGAAADKSLQFQHPQVLCTAGEIPLREVFALTSVVDLVVGPESAIINAAGCFPTPKLVLLSHSLPDNLTKYWQNTTALEPDVSCGGCLQLHYTRESCPSSTLVQIGSGGIEREAWKGPVCALKGITPERLQAELDRSYSAWAQAR